MPRAWLESLVDDGRAIRVKVAGEDRFAAVEDAARLRDALGVSLPRGLPGVFTEPTDRPLETLVARFARTHGPFTAVDVGARLGASTERDPQRPRSARGRGSRAGGRVPPGGVGPRVGRHGRACAGCVSVPSRPCARRSNRSRPRRWGGSSRRGRAPTGPAAPSDALAGDDRAAAGRPRSPPPSWRPTSSPRASVATAPPTSTPCAPAATWCGSAPNPWAPTTAALVLCFREQVRALATGVSPVDPPDGRAARRRSAPISRHAEPRSGPISCMASGTADERILLRALWDLVWAGRGDERHPGAGAGVRPRRLGEGSRGPARFAPTARSAPATGPARRRRTMVAGRRSHRTRTHAHRSRARPRAPAARSPRRAHAGVGPGGEHPGRVRGRLSRPQGDGGSRQGPPWLLRGRPRRGAVRAPRRGGSAPLDA